ncbi:MAG: (Fe-S)-binding protein [Promethearchaeota archaeon]
MGAINALTVYQLLPKLNCKKCSAKLCMPFAVELLKGSAKIEDCPPLMEPKYKKNREKLEELLAPMEEATETGIVLHDDLCDGCGICVIACPVNSRYSPECLSGKAPLVPSPDGIIYALENGKCKIKTVDTCRRYVPPRTNCQICGIFCPRHAIEIKI